MESLSHEYEIPSFSRVLEAKGYGIRESNDFKLQFLPFLAHSRSVEEHGVLVGENGDGRFFEEDPAVMVTEQADAQQVVMEVGYDVPCGRGELGEKEITCGG